MKSDQIKSFDDYRKSVGNTSLIAVPSRPGGARILAKIEWTNPTGSVKDRAALAMLDRLLTEHSDQTDDIHILEYSGGNLGVAISFACKLLSVPNTLFLSSSSPDSLIVTLKSNGTDVRLVDSKAGFLGVMEATKEYSKQHPYMKFLYQHENGANPQAHEENTGRETVTSLTQDYNLTPEKGPLAVAAAIGTGGTLAGLSKAILKWKSDAEVYGVTPAELPYGSFEPPNGLPKFGGSGGLGHGICQRFVSEIKDHVNGHLKFSYPESLSAKYLFKQLTGEVIGSSAGAAWLASMDIADQLGSGGTVVTVFACRGTPEEEDKAASQPIRAVAEQWRKSWFEK